MANHLLKLTEKLSEKSPERADARELMLRCPGVTLFGKKCGHGAVGDPIKNEKIKLGNPHVSSSPRQLLGRFLPQGGAAACGARESLESETPFRGPPCGQQHSLRRPLFGVLFGARARALADGKSRSLRARRPRSRRCLPAQLRGQRCN